MSALAGDYYQLVQVLHNMSAEMDRIHDALQSGDLLMVPLYSGDAFWMRDSIGKTNSATPSRLKAANSLSTVPVLRSSINPQLARNFIAHLAMKHRLAHPVPLVTSVRIKQPVIFYAPNNPIF